jgi:hypothetical protein
MVVAEREKPLNERILPVLQLASPHVVAFSYGEDGKDPYDKSGWTIFYDGDEDNGDRAAVNAAVQSFVCELTKVPSAVTPYQARRALTAAGLRDAAEAAIASASQDVKDAWEYALTIERNSPFIEAVGAALGLSSVEIDELFSAAATY